MKMLFVAMCVFVSSLSYAGSQVGTVSYINVRSSDGLIFFRVIGGERTDAPSCATGDYWIIRDENSNAGKQQYEMLLAAQTAGKTVSVFGRDTCVRWSDGEDVDYLQINN